MTIEQMNQLAERIDNLRRREEEASSVKKSVTNELESAENEMIVALQEGGLKNYRAPAGLCTVTFRTSVKTPKTPEEKAAFYGFLKENGYYDELISVNSQKLNSFYKEQMELAIERGDDDFALPGIEGVTVTPNLSFKR